MAQKKHSFSIPDAHSMTAVSIASVLGVTRQTVGAWDCPRNDDRTYDLPRVIEWRIARAEQDATANAGAGKKDREATRLKKAQADKAEMEVGTMRGELVRVSDVEREWGVLLSRLRTRLVQLPILLSPLLDPAAANTAIPIVEREVKAALDDVVAQYEGVRS